VGDRAEVYVDGGLRRAPDVVKALALGARAVLVGRPSLWALAVGGADGVASLLQWYESELRRTMALCGAATVDQLERSLVRRAPGWSLEHGA
jgi:4-hydroxymandelate oxidase